MADSDRAVEPVANFRSSNLDERKCLAIRGFIDMQIYVEPVLGRSAEQEIEAPVQVGPHLWYAAEQTP